MKQPQNIKQGIEMVERAGDQILLGEDDTCSSKSPRPALMPWIWTLLRWKGRTPILALASDTVRQTRLKTLCAKNYRGSDDEWAQIVSYVFGQLRKAHWIRRFGLSKKRSGSAEGEGKHVVWLDGADQLQGYLSCSMETGAPLNAPMESSQFEEGCASSSTIVPQTQSGVGVQAPQSPTSEVPESLTAMSQRHNAKPKFRARNNRNNEKQKPATQAGQQDSVLSKRYHCAVCDVSRRDAASLRIHNKSKRHAKKMEMGDSDYNCDTCNISFRFLSDFNRHKKSKGAY
ncbi:hypothetical protein CFD26_104820 [Aspergillus turcosus]|uniref:C2H2-type domain-containing protein n=1 Tax=Aspergillus turcosus TaxID=1245748 RepID=A0A3R7F4Q1_9EURO|nr:hypothetical protein CFD26_104820 [Aspergillus turcosus]